MIKTNKLGKKDKKFIKKVGRNTTNFLRILEKYEDYLNKRDIPSKEKDAMFMGISMMPIQLIVDSMENKMKKEMLMFLFLHNRDMLMNDVYEHMGKKMKERKVEKDYIG